VGNYRRWEGELKGGGGELNDRVIVYVFRLQILIHLSKDRGTKKGIEQVLKQRGDFRKLN